MDSKSLALPVKKILQLEKRKKKSRFEDTVFSEKLSDSTCKLASFSQVGSQVANLELKTYPQLDIIFILRKQGKKTVGCVLPVTRL